MLAMRHAPKLTRTAWGAILGLLLGLRLLSPAGFMPAFAHGQVAIVVCPDADGTAAPIAAHHHHGGDHSAHQPCPYAAASSLGAVGSDPAPLMSAAALFAVPLAPAPPQQLSSQHGLVRPPSRGPPIPA